MCEDGTFNLPSADTDSVDTHEQSKPDPEVRGGAAGSGLQDNDRKKSYHSERLSCIDTQRTGLRGLDDHGSWRAVMYACHADARGHR